MSDCAGCPQTFMDECRKTYDEFDHNHNGKVSAREIEKVLIAQMKKAGKQVDHDHCRQQADAFLKEGDKDRNGTITFEEYVEFCKKHAKK
jgi:Ca2+-binding EF-hand superfamily protein